MKSTRIVKILCLLCAAVLPLVAQGQFYYATNDDGTITITGFSLSPYDPIIVPSTINGRTVTGIGNNAFTGIVTCNVTIPDTVTSIANNAFGGNRSVVNVSIGNGLTNIEDFAFAFCSSLTSVLIQGNAPATGGTTVFGADTNVTVYYTFGTTGWGPTFCLVPTVLWNPPGYNYTTNNATVTITGYTGSGGSVTVPASIHSLPVTCIGSNAFYQCNSLTYISIPNTVTNISDSAFSGCSNLTVAVIPTSVGSVGDFVFADCTSLGGIYFLGSAPTVGSGVFSGDTNAAVYYLLGTTGWGATFGGLQTVQLNVPYSYTNYSGTISITGYTGSGGAAVIPSTINGLPVTAIVSNAFNRCGSLTSVSVPDSVITIGDNAFSGCSNMTSVTLSTNIANIYNGVFSGCSRLASITIPPNVTSIGASAFAQGTSLTNVTIPNNVTSIGDSAFAGCNNMLGITLPTNITSIGNGLFSRCSDLTNVTIPGNVASIGSNAFYGCTSLISITVPNSITNIGDNAFSGCSKLTSIVLPNSITSIGNALLSGCSSLTNVTIPNSVTTIGYYAFAHCASLRSLIIPNNVTNIGFDAFSLCFNLKGVYFEGNAPNVGSSAFLATSATVYYLPGATGWGTTFGSPPVPTAVWKPQIQSNDGNFGVRPDGFGFNITWASNMVVVVQVSSNLAGPSWTAMATNNLTNGLFYFSDPVWTNYPARFYRVSS